MTTEEQGEDLMLVKQTFTIRKCARFQLVWKATSKFSMGSEKNNFLDEAGLHPVTVTHEGEKLSTHSAVH